MIVKKLKILKLVAILLIINAVLIFILIMKRSNDKKNIVIVNEKTEIGSNIIFEVDDYRYDFYIEKSKPNDFNKFFITVTDLDNSEKNIYSFSTVFHENEIISTGIKNEKGFSMKYDLNTEKMNLYNLPLKMEQLETENIDGEEYILPPEF